LAGYWRSQWLPVVRLGRSLRVPWPAIERLLTVGAESAEGACGLDFSVDASAGRTNRGDDGRVLLSPRCRGLRRQLRPLAWMVLEDVALDAVVEGGRLVARASARRLAEQLGIDPGTAANALAQLRRTGLLALEREPGRSGRFGLAVSVLGDVAGLAVISPCGAGPRMAGPEMVPPCGVDADIAPTGTTRIAKGTTGSGCSPRPDPAPATPYRQDPAPVVVASGQGALDLGLGPG
jgi:hypothetical protein